MLIEYIDGQPLDLKNVHREEYRDHIFTQLATLFFELYQLPFDRIGSFGLDEENDTWTFGDQRPLQSSMSEQAVAGYQPDLIIPPGRTYTSTIEYVYLLAGLALNDWVKARHNVFEKGEAEEDLYDLYQFRAHVVDWVLPEMNNGPFYLMHGDLLPSNILVDSDMNFMAIIDWEWCRTVPAQLFVPPAWISGFDISLACTGAGYIYLFAGTTILDRTLMEMIPTRCPEYKTRWDAISHPLEKLWQKTVDNLESFCTAHALHRPDKAMLIYADSIDDSRHSEDREKRLAAFSASKWGQKQQKLISKKVEDGLQYKQELKERGIPYQGKVTVKPIPVPDNMRKFLGQGIMRRIYWAVVGALENRRW